ncbi:hypothetical protein GGH96_003945, partial [Coemansia sp. RSA 1972]
MFRLGKHDHFLGFVTTDGVSISVIRKSKEEPTETSAKHPCDELQQQEQEQLAAKRARLSYWLQPPLVLSSYVSMPLQPPSVPSSLSFMWQPLLYNH